MDEVNDNLMATLQKSGRLEKLLAQFDAYTSNAEKIRFVQRLLKRHKNVPTEPNAGGILSKDDTKSVQFAQCGDKWFSQNREQNFNALVNFNESLCFAEANGENLAIAYAKRSAVYYDWKLYSLCLENVALARAAGCPKELLDVLEKREDMCELFLKSKIPDESSTCKTESTDVYEPKLSFPAHPTVPFIANCLELRKNEEYGRYIITNRSLEPGQVLAIESSYFNVLLPKLRYQRCANCLEENSLCLIPCDNCTGTMFCSAECKHTAQTTFHQYECPIIDYLHTHFNRIQLCALRSTIKAFLCYPNSLDDLMEAISKNESSETTVFSVNQTDKSATSDYLQIHTFPTKQEARPVESLFQEAVVAVALYQQLISITKFNELLKTTAQKNILLELLFRHLQIAPMYFHTLSLADKQYQSSQGGVRGSGAYPFCSLINHACAPNIVRIPFGTKMVIFALRVIKSGEQLFDNYR